MNDFICSAQIDVAVSQNCVHSFQTLSLASESQSGQRDHLLTGLDPPPCLYIPVHHGDEAIIV